MLYRNELKNIEMMKHSMSAYDPTCYYDTISQKPHIKYVAPMPWYTRPTRMCDPYENVNYNMTPRTTLPSNCIALVDENGNLKEMINFTDDDYRFAIGKLSNYNKRLAIADSSSHME